MKKQIITVLGFFLISIVSLNAQIWNQVGSNIIGDDNYDYFGKVIDMSSNGNIVAIGSSSSEKVKVYQKNSVDSWIQLGSDITGASGSAFGINISLNTNGNLLLIGAPNDDSAGSNNGKVSLFEYTSGSWSLVEEFEGDNPDDHMGYGVALSNDGSTLAVGSYTNDDGGTNAGQIKIYKNSGGSWTLDGIINGNEGDLCGNNIKLNNTGNILVIGMKNNSNDVGTNAGLVRVYQASGSNWVQLGNDIKGNAAYDYFGGSISTSFYGNIIAVGATKNDESGTNAGCARIFQYISGDWQEIAKINGEREYDNAGSSVDLNYNGTIIAIGAEQNYENETDAGHVRVFKNNSGIWLQQGQDVDGQYEGDKLGSSVAISATGNDFTTGAPYYSHSGANKGLVKIYHLDLPPTITSHPSDQTNICIGSTVDYTVSADDVNDYQWQYSSDNVNFQSLSNNSNYSGVTTSTLSVTTSETFNGYYYRCLLNGVGGISQSNSASLILDNEAPVIAENFSSTIHRNTGIDNCYYTTCSFYISATDNCTASDDLIKSQSIPVGTQLMAGTTHTMTLTAIDEMGNVGEYSFNIIVDEPYAPVLESELEDQEVDANGNCEAVLPDYTTLPVTVSDNCTPTEDIAITQVPAPGTVISGTTNQVQLVFTDNYGNATDALINPNTVFNVAVVDNTAPTVTCIPNQEVDADETNHYTVVGSEFDLTDPSDNCSLSTVINDFNSTGSLAGSVLPAGTTTITWTLTDEAGNSTDCSFDILVNDFSGLTNLSKYNISIYPNPTNSNLTINSENEIIEKITISDITGKIIKQVSANKNQVLINLSKNANGIYFAEIQTNNNTFISKIIKK